MLINCLDGRVQESFRGESAGELRTQLTKILNHLDNLGTPAAAIHVQTAIDHLDVDLVKDEKSSAEDLN